jgi:hypothetical protein
VEDDSSRKGRAGRSRSMLFFFFPRKDSISWWRSGQSGRTSVYMYWTQSSGWGHLHRLEEGSELIFANVVVKTFHFKLFK